MKRSTKIWIAVIYLVCPLDLDFIPILGWIDDALVMAYALTSPNEEQDAITA